MIRRCNESIRFLVQGWSTVLCRDRTLWTIRLAASATHQQSVPTMTSADDGWRARYEFVLVGEEVADLVAGNLVADLAVKEDKQANLILQLVEHSTNDRLSFVEVDGEGRPICLTRKLAAWTWHIRFADD